MDTFLMRQYTFLVAPQHQAAASLQCTFLLPGTRLQTRAGCWAEYRKAHECNAYCQGDSRTTITITIGCLF